MKKQNKAKTKQTNKNKEEKKNIYLAAPVLLIVYNAQQTGFEIRQISSGQLASKFGEGPQNVKTKGPHGPSEGWLISIPNV